MSIELHIANHLRLAHEDLDAAEMLIRVGNRYGAYHLQQAAEKLLLALLTAEEVKAERRNVHRLDVLLDLLPEINAFKARLQPLAFLTIYATTYRYPKDAGRLPAKPEKSELDASMIALADLINDAALHFGVDLAGSDRIAAKTVAPPRS
ncbi:HEPN domain-containing protein [Xaviernesmea oryzae]|uniref:HEPN domain-containing protein n=1 Tax=Xaviernesmea oryzae TaxID=464029 RepID=UPI0011139323|nr:HEPN domain-containing protein [Xaviernesmea oryzae]